MEEEINIEIDICGDNLNDEFVNETVKEKNIDSQDTPGEKASNYLTASELFVLRKDICKNKGKDEDIELSRGPKLYAPSESVCEKEKMSDLLQNQRKSLSLQRGAKIRDCMKAEWIDELKVAIVPSLKGKSTQHMGHNMKGKIALSPEEAVFLLEKSCIEIKRNNMPLSVEEAYAVMLNGKLGIEKYQVYSLLSQQGFIVVQHQSRIGPSYEQLMNLSKKKQKKRKGAFVSSDEPPEKRLTFSGVLASSSEINSSVNAENILSSDYKILNNCESPIKVISEDALNDDQNIHIDNVLNRNEKLESVESEDITVYPNSTNRIDSNDITEKDVSLSVSKEVTCDDNVKVMNEPVGSLESCVDNAKVVNEPIGSLESCVDNVKVVNESVGSLESCVDDVKVVNEPVASLESQKPNLSDNGNSVSGIKTLEKEATDAVNDKELNGSKEIDNNNINDIEVEYAGVDTNEVTINKLDNREDINVEDVLSDIDNEEYVSSDSVPVVCDESSEDQSLDVLSCSTSDQSLFDDFNSSSNNMYGGFLKEHDDEVTLVEVKVKENMPLAVIDLLSDEEQDNPKNNEESFEGSDDEIQVVKVCPVTAVNKGQANSRPVRSVKSECKKENIPVNIKSSYQQKMKFPELFRKEILCLPCPPTNLLPNHVQPAKEAYVINRRKKFQSSQSSQPNRGRMWNSFRELQDYQRERRINSGRPLKSFREFRYHNEAFYNRNSSFNTQENSRDIGYDRNNQNFRDSGYNRNNNRNSPFIAQENSRDMGFDRNNQNSRDIGYDRNNPNPRDMGYDRNNSNPREMDYDRKNPNLRDMGYDRNNSNPREMEYDRKNQNPRDMGFDRSNQNFSPQPDQSFNASFLPFNHQERNISLPSVGAFNPTNQMPFMNIPNLQNLSASNPVAFVSEIQKTVYSVASSMLSSMLGSHLTPPARSSPTFNEPPMMGLPHHQYNNFTSTPVIPNHMALNANIKTDFHPMNLPDPMFSGERYPFSATMEPMLDNSWRPNNFRRRNFQQGPMFPCPYREGGKKRSWNDVKASVDGASTNASDSGSDIEEIPINLNQILWSNDIQPLVKPGTKLPVSQVLKSLRITKMANLLDRRYPNDRYLPATSSLEISFDVYLPGSKYKKTAPHVPKHRIIVLRSGDPIPKYSEIVVLQKKWNDKALLQIAVVDHGDVTFFSFNSINVPEMVPHKS